MKKNEIITPICGFSKLSKLERLDFVVDQYLNGNKRYKSLFKNFWNSDENYQRLFDQLSENTLSNFDFPYGVIPDLLVNEKTYCVPMVTEESSVVAAASRSAKFWRVRGGFKSEVISTIKVGQVHFYYFGDIEKLKKMFDENIDTFLKSLSPLNENMIQRGGGVKNIELIDYGHKDEGYCQLLVKFETCEAMGANYINTNLEYIAGSFLSFLNDKIPSEKAEIIMSIVSNYNPECLVKSYVNCKISDMVDPKINLSPFEFASKFNKAVKISKIDLGRAVTHNKGIMNGIDSVVLATGNDFRAVEASIHAYAAKDGNYKGLTQVSLDLKNDEFYYELIIPLSLGTVGGITSLHPLVKLSFDMLGKPNVKELMTIVASVGLAQNFAAIRSLITSGIQKGHMKMHLINILNQLEASNQERELAKKCFQDKIITFKEVRSFLANSRNYH